jgi:hypothetical protein
MGFLLKIQNLELKTLYEKNYARRESYPQRADSKSTALSIELRAHEGIISDISSRVIRFFDVINRYQRFFPVLTCNFYLISLQYAHA